MSQVRILRIVTRLNIGGPAIHVSLLSTRLDPERFITDLVVGTPDATEGDLSELAQGGAARLIACPTLRRPLNPWADLWTLGCLLWLVWQRQPQVIHTHMAKAGTLGRLAGVLYNRVGPGRAPHRRIRLVHTFHGHVLEGYFQSWLARIFLVIERWLARQTDCLIAVSPAVRDELLAKGIGRPEQWRVIHLGLELSHLASLDLPHGAGAVRVGLVGRLVPIKNPGLLLQAMAGLQRRSPSTRITGVLVGDGPLRQALEREAAQLGLNGFVAFAGWQRDLRAVYGGLDVVCLTSWNEGTPVSLIEAMAAGRAVIATAVGGVWDLVSDTKTPRAIPLGQFYVTSRGVLVRPGDVEGLAKALHTVAADPLLRRRIGETARAYVLQRHSVNRLLQDISSLYEQLLEQHEPNSRPACHA